MTSPSQGELPVNAALRRAHRSVLFVLAACAAVIALSTADEDSGFAGDPPRAFAYTATALGIASILTRRRRAPTTPGAARGHIRLSLSSLLFAGGVGLVGIAAVVAGTPRRTALIYVLAGAIFAMRPPPPMRTLPAADSP